MNESKPTCGQNESAPPFPTHRIGDHEVMHIAFVRQIQTDLTEMSERCEVLQELNDTLRRSNITLMDQRDELQESIEQEKRNRAAACATLTKDCNLYAKRTHQLLMGILNLRTEINCRIEHGADSGGHLEYVQSALDSIKNVPDSSRLICEVAGKSQPE